MNINQSFPYSSRWQLHGLIALTSGTVLAFILIFLQPFDTYASQPEYKSLKLAGYAFTVMVPYLVVHGIESLWYSNRKSTWRVWNEILMLLLFAGLVIVSAYFYHNAVFNGPPIRLQGLWQFGLYMGVPFLPLFIPLTGYLRFKAGTYNFFRPQPASEAVTVFNRNKTEHIKLLPSHFLLAEARQNYVTIYFTNEQQQVNKAMLRLTLSEACHQLPGAEQVHRSFLVNLSRIEHLDGNKRKAHLTVQPGDFTVPVGQKYYDALKTHRQVRP